MLAFLGAELHQQRRLRTLQRKMLRMVLNAKRWKLEANSDQSSSSDVSGEGESEMLEPWPDFLKRTTLRTEKQLEKAGKKEWLVTWRTRQWKWACMVMNEDKQKWSADCTLWGRPKKRWGNDFAVFFRNGFPDEHRTWIDISRCSEEWASLCDRFVNWASEGI